MTLVFPHGSQSYQNQASVALVSGAVAMLRLLGPDVQIASRGVMVFLDVVFLKVEGGRLVGLDLDGVVVGLRLRRWWLLLWPLGFRVHEGLLRQRKSLTLSLGLLGNVL